MYTISGGRRLYTFENGKYRFIKRDQVFESETIYVLIKPMRLKRYTENIYIEKELTFNQGTGNYKLIDSQPLIERVYIYLLALAGVSMLIAYALVVIDDGARFNVPSSLIILCGVLWLSLTAGVFICRQYFKSNYEQYARALNDCSVRKSE